jgi:2-isopropylmalate synthase
MSCYEKYKYPEPIPIENRQWPDRVISKAPTWTSVDLRDGNQALPVPMNPKQKLAYFKLLVKIGFKEIEVGFPSASKDDYNFVRRLIEEDYIPDDVTISVLTQARKHLIDKTAESLRGVKSGIIHCYVATCDLHGRFVFNFDRAKVREMAVEGTKMIMAAIADNGLTGKVGYEFSPEEFTDSDIDFVIDICTELKQIWGPSTKKDFILNLPATVERRPPYHYADMIEYFCRKYPAVEETAISVHCHNDQGCAVAASEMALLAGADRVEGTIFGHGERTGNLDIAILALNLFSRGIDTGLDFSDMQTIVETIEAASGIDVHPRHPYSGRLVFTAFSGSHQDAIRKGIERREEISEFFKQDWKIPYLHIDPADLGRSYEKLIRINSQSGKGGVAYVLEHDFGIYPPKPMHPEIGAAVQRYAESKGDEINADEVLQVFEKQFLNIKGKYKLDKYQRTPEGDPGGEKTCMMINLEIDGKSYSLHGCGNGPISAVVHALRECDQVINFTLEDFYEKTLGHDADATAIAFIGVRREDGSMVYGAGRHSNIDRAAIKALFCALNRAANG